MATMLATLSACTTYQTRPLPEQSPLAMDLDTLRVDAKALHPGLGADGAVHDLDPADGLDLTELNKDSGSWTQALHALRHFGQQSICCRTVACLPAKRSLLA